MPKPLSEPFQECCTRFIAAVDAERSLAVRQSTVTSQLGCARGIEVRLAASVSGASQHLDGSTPEQLIQCTESFIQKKDELRRQSDTVVVLASVRSQLQEQQFRAAEECARQYANFLKAAHDEFRRLWGKTSERFQFWDARSQEELEWRQVIFAHLLGICQKGSEGTMEMLRAFLRGDPFPLSVSRGFYLKTADGAMAGIEPTRDGSCLCVPEVVPFRDAFEQIINGRAQFNA